VGFLSYVVGQVQMGESEGWFLLGQFVRLVAAGFLINECGCKRGLGDWMVVLSTTLEYMFVIFIDFCSFVNWVSLCSCCMGWVMVDCLSVMRGGLGVVL